MPYYPQGYFDDIDINARQWREIRRDSGIWNKCAIKSFPVCLTFGWEMVGHNQMIFPVCLQNRVDGPKTIEKNQNLTENLGHTLAWGYILLDYIMCCHFL